MQEDGLTWQKSTYTEAGACVEIAHPEGGVLVRDSKRPNGIRIPLQPAAWYTLVDWAKGHQV